MNLIDTPEQRAKWRDEFIRAAVASGALTQENAEELFEASIDNWNYEMDPADAFAEEVEYWTDDGDTE